MVLIKQSKNTCKTCQTTTLHSHNEKTFKRSKSTGDIKKLYEQNLIYESLTRKKRPLTVLQKLRRLASPKRYAEPDHKDDVAKDKFRYKGCTPRIKQLSAPKMARLLDTWDSFRHTLPIKNAEMLSHNLTATVPMNLSEAQTFYKGHFRKVRRLEQKQRHKKSCNCNDISKAIFEFAIKLSNYLCDRNFIKLQNEDIVMSRKIFQRLNENNKICSVPKRTSVNLINRGLWQAMDQAALFAMKIICYIDTLSKSSYEPSTLSSTTCADEEVSFIEYIDPWEEKEFDLETLIALTETYYENNALKQRVFSKQNLPDLLFTSLIEELKKLKETHKEDTPLNVLAKVFQEKFNNYVIQTRPDLLSEKACRVICFASYELARLLTPITREPSETSIRKNSAVSIRTICSNRSGKPRTRANVDDISISSSITVETTEGEAFEQKEAIVEEIEDQETYNNQFLEKYAEESDTEEEEEKEEEKTKEEEEMKMSEELKEEQQIKTEEEQFGTGEEEQFKTEEEEQFKTEEEQQVETEEEERQFETEEEQLVETEEEERQFETEEEQLVETEEEERQFETEEEQQVETEEEPYEVIEKSLSEGSQEVIKVRTSITVMPHEPDMVCCASVKAWATWLKEVADNTRNWSKWIQSRIATARGLIQTLCGERFDENGNVISLRREQWNDFVVQLDRDVVRWRHYNEHVQELTEEIVSHFKNKRVECCSICLKEGWSVYDLDIEHLCSQLIEALETTQNWRKWLGNIIDQTESIMSQTMDDNGTFLEISNSGEMLKLIADKIIKTRRNVSETSFPGSVFSITKVRN